MNIPINNNKFNNPVLIYIVISLSSLVCAVIFFWIGGSVAEVVDKNSELLGISFKAGGALAGFIIIFLLSKNAIIKFDETLHKEDTYTLSQIIKNRFISIPENLNKIQTITRTTTLVSETFLKIENEKKISRDLCKIN